jgi:stage II sporulation protein D
MIQLVFALIFSYSISAFGQSIKVRVYQSNQPVTISGTELRIEGAGDSSATGLVVTKVSGGAAETVGAGVAAKTTGNEDAPGLAERVGQSLEVIPTNNKFKVERLQDGERPYWIFSTGLKTANSSFVLRGKTIFIDGRQWPQPVTFVAGVKSKINAVISVPLEDYVAGVVAGEMPAAWPMEALMAQAIASRSYVLAQLHHQDKQLFDTDSSQNNQVYKWVRDPKKGKMWRIEEAVKRTAGTVLLDKKGEPLWAYYHADCGGHTEEPHAVWNNKMFFGTVKEASCPANPQARWQANVSMSLANAKLQPILEKKGRIVDVELGEPTQSGRIRNMKLKLADGTEQSIRTNQFRQQVGFGWIKSTMFGMSKRGENLFFTGQGFGHGVGLCQWGTRALAKSGKSHLAILKNYYPLAKIDRAQVTP